MMTLIAGGDVDAPGPIGRRDVLAAGGRIARIGAVDTTTRTMAALVGRVKAICPRKREHDP